MRSEVTQNTQTVSEREELPTNWGRWGERLDRRNYTNCAMSANPAHPEAGTERIQKPASPPRPLGHRRISVRRRIERSRPADRPAGKPIQREEGNNEHYGHRYQP